MGGTYGMSQTAKYIQQGLYAEAIAEATAGMERDATDPEPLYERAQAQSALDRHAEAALDLENAMELDKSAGVLDADAVDDAYFSALLGAARKEAETDVETGVRRLAHYDEMLPEGTHTKDAADWTKRLRGQLKSTFIKEH